MQHLKMFKREHSHAKFWKRKVCTIAMGRREKLAW
jgi:hypothetical protein